MKVLKKRISRAVLIAIIFAIVTSTALGFLTIAVNAPETEPVYNNYLYSSDYMHDVTDLYTQLWVATNMYLANIDENGNYTVNEYHQAALEKLFGEWGIVKDGWVVLDNFENLEYHAVCGNTDLSNTDNTIEDLRNTGYAFEATYNGTIYPTNGGFYGLPECQVYNTSYGLTQYVVNGTVYNVYDFDTANLPYYYEDRLKYYYKTDGSTPLPSSDDLILDCTPYFIYDTSQLSEVLGDIMQNNIEDARIFRVDENGYTIALYDLEAHKWIEVRAEGNMFSSPGNYGIARNDIRICIAPTRSVILNYEENENILSDYYTKETRYLIALCAFLAMAFVIAVVYWVFCGYDVKQGRYRLSFLDKMFTEVYLAAFAFLVFFAVVLIDEFLGGIGMYGYWYNYASEAFADSLLSDMFIRITLSAGVGAAAITGVLVTGAIINKFKTKHFIKDSLIFKLLKILWRITKKAFKVVKNAFFSFGRATHTAFMKRFLLRLIILSAIAFVMLLLTMDPEVFIVVCVLLAIVYVFFEVVDAVSIAKLTERIENIRNGDYSVTDVKEWDVNYKAQQDLNNISESVTKVVEEQIKSERMKIDLVTNVSHDLKTPLTSITSYVDLLSKEDLPDEAKDYVNILIRKTERLNAMIGDLFDLAKATSETDVKLEELDAVILVRQVLADMEDKINRYGRDVRLEILPQSVKVIGEGKKLYRIIQNVVDNALKYSLENTRIYLTLTENENEAIITVKNIASYEMDFTGDEITERFVRGSKSRTGEGNGLGLSIAKSFTQACGGSFTVTPDGDVFTAEIRLKKV